MLDLQTIHQRIDIIPEYTGHPDANDIIQFLFALSKLIVYPLRRNFKRYSLRF